MHAPDCAATFHLYFYTFYCSQKDFLKRNFCSEDKEKSQYFVYLIINALYLWIEKS